MRLPDVPVLAFDTSTERLALALHVPRAAGGGATPGAFTFDTAGGALASAALLPQARTLLDRAGLRWTDLGAIAFGQGPGAFTGLRTACAVAQGLAFGLGLRLWPLDSLLIVAEDARVQAGVDAGPWQVAVAMDARMDECYAGRWCWHDSAWCELQAAALCDLPALARAWLQGEVQAVAGSALSAFGPRLAVPAGARPLAHEQDRAAALLRLALQAVREGPGVDPAAALPLYLRDKVALTTAERAAVRVAPASRETAA